MTDISSDEAEATFEEFPDLAAMIPGMFGSIPFDSFYDSDASPYKQVASLDPLKAASVFAGMLLDPSLQANCLRLEALVHILLQRANGRQKITAKHVANLFAALEESLCARLEDPSEDVFASAVRTERGNFKILEGVWEGNTFYLQRFLNAVEGMPRGGGYDQLRESIFALLKLSDLAADRSGLGRNCLGEELPREKLGEEHLSRLARYRSWVRFSFATLEEHGIDPINLAPFMFDVRKRSELGDQQSGDSVLEKYPVLRDASHVYLILPTAVSAAIRLFVLRQMNAGGMQGALSAGLASDYSDLLSRSPLLGGHLGPELRFRKIDGFIVTGATIQIDVGRYLNLVFVADDLEDVLKTGLCGVNPAGANYAEKVGDWIDWSWDTVPSDPNFRGCLSVFVSCGVGRGLAFGFPNLDRPNWQFEFLSAYDFFTLSWTPDFKPLTLWRILDAKKNAEGLGAYLSNMNGLINLVGWSRELDSHIVPHGALPDDFIGDQPAFLMIGQNSQRTLRHDVLQAHDPRVAEYVDGRWIRIRKNALSELAEDRAAPLYASEEMVNSKPLSCYRAPQRVWWAQSAVLNDVPGFIAYERWRLVSMWLSRAAPTLDRMASLSARPILWEARFTLAEADTFEAQPEMDEEAIRGATTVEIDRSRNAVITTCTADFEYAFNHLENVAERTRVERLVEGVFQLCGKSDQDTASVVSAIVRSPQARHGHAFQAQSARDYLRDDLRGKVVFIDSYDDAAVRLGLGWQVRSRDEGSVIEGKADCQSYLNALVSHLQADLLIDLQRFQKEPLLETLIRNYEVAVFDRERWRRTSSAVIALRDNKDDAMRWIADHEMRLNGVFQATRILVEMAATVSPPDSGEIAGELEISQLMAKAAALFLHGGYSDAIRWDVMEPELRITPLGDVHANFDFVDAIVEPHSQDTSRVRIEDNVKSYPDYLQEPAADASVAHLFDNDFLEAWQEQFGADFDQTRVLVDYLEDIGIRAGKAVLRIKRSDISDVKVEENRLPDDVAQSLLDKLILPFRESYEILPDGYNERDLRPWLFRRELSFLRRPIVQIDGGADPKLLYAPGMVREALVYSLRNFHEGNFPEHQLAPNMRTWKHRVEGKRGAKFEKKVAEAFADAGWKAECGVKITKILGRSTDRDYGDVDVLAWDLESGRVLAIECKDVQFRKTLGEMAEQLASFRGGLNSRGKPDYLAKHLDRMQVLRDHLADVAKYTGFQNLTDVESHLMFRHPVPMEHALKNMSEKVTVSHFANVRDLLSPQG